MARRPLRNALASFAAGVLDVAPTEVVEPVRDAVPDNANELFTSRGAGFFGFGTGVLVNAITRAGTQQDASFWARWTTQRFLGRREHFALGRNGLTQQALKKIGDTATREWHNVELKDEDATVESKKIVAQKVLDYETRLGLQQILPEALARGRQYGDALVLLGIIDGRDADQPVDLEKLLTIKWAVVIDRRDFDYERVSGPESPNFGKPELYRVTDLDGVLQDGVRFFGEGTTNFDHEQLTEYYSTNGQLVVHADRVMRFPTGDALSMLDTIQDSLEAYFTSIGGLKNAARDAGTVVYKISKMLQKSWHNNGGQVATEHIRKVHAGKAAANAYIIDKDHEDITALPSNLSGLDKAVNPMMVWLAASLNIPVTEYWQVSPTGFGTGESEEARWHTTANAFQQKVIYPELKPLHGYMLVAKDGGIHLPADTRREIVPGDLSPPNEETRSKLRSEVIDDMVKLVKADLISRAEARDSLPSDDLFSIQLEEEVKDELAEAPVGVWQGSIVLAQAMSPTGVVAPEFAAFLASKLSSKRFNREEFLREAQAQSGAAGLEGLEGGERRDPIVPSTRTQTRRRFQPVELGSPDGEEDDAHAQAWEAGQEPADTKTSTELGEIFRLAPQKITSFAKRNGIKNWDTLGGRGRFSQREFEAEFMDRNDTAPPRSLTVMVPIPAEVAAQFPEDKERGDPHVTLLHIGDAKPRERDKMRKIVERVVLDSSVKGGTVSLGALDYFDQPDEDRRVAFSSVDFDPPLDKLHRELKKALTADGFEVAHSSDWLRASDGEDRDFTPHATLAYLSGMESEHTGEVPTGEWPLTIELWWGDKHYPLDLVAPEPEAPAAAEGQPPPPLRE